MRERMRATQRLVLVASAVAFVGFGLASYGVFGPVASANAILETTSQSPIEVLPRPTPAPIGANAPESARATVAWAPVLAMVIVLVLVASSWGWWRRRRPSG